MSKKLLSGMLVLGLVSLAAAGIAQASIVGSVHDFSSSSFSGGQICIVCHTPHNASSTIAPLWNHAVTSQTFTLYSSPSLNAAVAQPNSASKACLSCHDGTVAIDSFGGNTGTNFVTGSELLGTDLSNDHPVSFTFNTGLATTDGGLFDPATKLVPALGAGKTIQTGMLVSDKLECVSCHDAHRTKGDSPSAGNLLLVNNSGSALCLTCHNK